MEDTSLSPAAADDGWESTKDSDTEATSENHPEGPVGVPTEPEAEATEPEASAPEAPAETRSRRQRGDLELSVKDVTEDYVNGDLVLEADALLTPHRIAKEIERRTGNTVSTGAVSNIVKKWNDVGYCAVNEKPFAFTDYTEAAVTQGLAALKAQAKEAAKASDAGSTTDAV